VKPERSTGFSSSAPVPHRPGGAAGKPRAIDSIMEVWPHTRPHFGSSRALIVGDTSAERGEVPIVGGSGAHYCGVVCPLRGVMCLLQVGQVPIIGDQVPIIGGSGAHYEYKGIWLSKIGSG